MKEDAPQRVHALRDVFDAGAGWPKPLVRGAVPGDFPPWFVVGAEQALDSGGRPKRCDLRVLARRLQERAAQPSAAIFDGRTLQSSPESGARAGQYDFWPSSLDTLGHLLALVVTPWRTGWWLPWPSRCGGVARLRGATPAPCRRRRAHSGQTGRRQGFVLPRRWVVDPLLGGAFSAAVDYELLVPDRLVVPDSATCSGRPTASRVANPEKLGTAPVQRRNDRPQAAC